MQRCLAPSPCVQNSPRYAHPRPTTAKGYTGTSGRELHRPTRALFASTVITVATAHGDVALARCLQTQSAASTTRRPLQTATIEMLHRTDGYEMTLCYRKGNPGPHCPLWSVQRRRCLAQGCGGTAAYAAPIEKTKNGGFDSGRRAPRFTTTQRPHLRPSWARLRSEPGATACRATATAIRAGAYDVTYEYNGRRYTRSWTTTRERVRYVSTSPLP